MSNEVSEFLIAIAEPRSRPNHIHEYELTSTSLYSAASVQLKNEDIIKILDNFCKNESVPDEVKEYIDEHTKKYGKAKLILEQNRYKIEAESGIMKELKNIPKVREAHELALRRLKEEEK